MWTNMFLFLWIIGTVKYKSTPISIDCAKRVQKCPFKKDQWQQKNDQLNCTTDLRYVCMRDTGGYLFETCMTNVIIQANSRDCPTLYGCHKNRPYLGKETTFYYCPENVSGCPPRNHAAYSIHQLYKYPKCVESNFAAENGYTSSITTSYQSMDTSTDHDKRQEKNSAVVIILSTLSLAVLGCTIAYGCPYFTKDEGRIKVEQKECTGNKSGCPEATSDGQFLLSEVLKYPTCLPNPLITTKTKEYSNKVSTRYDFTEETYSRTPSHFDSTTTNGSTGNVDELFLTYHIFLFGLCLYVFVCALIGYVVFKLNKRIKELRARLGADFYIYSDPNSHSVTQTHQEFENEAIYDSVYNEDETSSQFGIGSIC